MKIRLLSLALLLAILLGCFTLIACNKTPGSTSGDPATSGNTSTVVPVTSEDDGEDKYAGVSTTVKLNGTTADISGEGAAFDAATGRLSLTKQGTYTLSGVLENGQIYVCVDKTERVQVILNGVSVTSKTGSAFYGDSSDKIRIVAAEGTTNTFTDAVKYQFEGTEPESNACIFSDDDLTFKGTGTLVVVGQYKNGISTKNDVKFAEGSVMVNAVNTGIRGKGSITIESGSVKVNAAKDGLKSTSTDAGKGYILISGGTVDIEAGDDAIQAESDVTVADCKVTVKCDGKTVNCAGSENIAEGCLTEK